MKIISDFYQDTQSEKRNSGSYEWWYFDAMSEKGYTVVIIFYEGNPFSRKYIQSIESGENLQADQFPAISISVYKGGETIFYSFEETKPDQADFSSSFPEGRVGKNLFKCVKTDNGFQYLLDIHQRTLSGDSVEGVLSFEPEHDLNTRAIETNGEIYSKHSWNLVAPRCNVNVKLDIRGHKAENVSFKGHGYHDHNLGFEPMKDSFTEWYWGRYHLKKLTLVYYLMKERSGWNKKAWLIGQNGEVEQLGKGIKKDHMQLNVFGLSSARTFTFTGRDTEIFLQNDIVIDNGPFYQRFEGRMIFKSSSGVDQCRGISEYIYPSRIYKKLFWPLVDMRIRYPGKKHWVQKNPFLYRITW